jgi:hypothetical protein
VIGSDRRHGIQYVVERYRVVRRVVFLEDISMIGIPQQCTTHPRRVSSSAWCVVGGATIMCWATTVVSLGTI